MNNYGWKAVYPDGSIIEQCPKGKEENSFKLIEDNSPIIFYVGDKYGVNLQTGQLFFDGKWLPAVCSDYDDFAIPFELLYFRRSSAILNDGRKFVEHNVGFKFKGGQVRIRIPEGGYIWTGDNLIPAKPTICIGSEKVKRGTA